MKRREKKKIDRFCKTMLLVWLTTLEVVGTLLEQQAIPKVKNQGLKRPWDRAFM